GEEGVGAGPECGRGLFLLVGQALGVGQPGVVIQRGVQVDVADPGASVGSALAGGGGAGVALAGGPAEHPGPAPAGAPVRPRVPAPVGDPGEFLDVHVDQLARGGVLVAADDPAGGPVQPAQP